MGELDDVSMNTLKMKRMLLDEIIRIAKEENDPRIEEPKRQLRIIIAEINKRSGLPEPKDVKIGLDSLVLGSKFNGRN